MCSKQKRVSHTLNAVIYLRGHRFIIHLIFGLLENNTFDESFAFYNIFKNYNFQSLLL